MAELSNVTQQCQRGRRGHEVKLHGTWVTSRSGFSESVLKSMGAVKRLYSDSQHGQPKGEKRTIFPLCKNVNAKAETLLEIDVTKAGQRGAKETTRDKVV